MKLILNSHFDFKRNSFYRDLVKKSKNNKRRTTLIPESRVHFYDIQFCLINLKSPINSYFKFKKKSASTITNVCKLKRIKNVMFTVQFAILLFNVLQIKITENA